MKILEVSFPKHGFHKSRSNEVSQETVNHFVQFIGSELNGQLF